LLENVLLRITRLPQEPIAVASTEKLFVNTLFRMTTDPPPKMTPPPQPSAEF
jgi:hypothetical protein